MYRILVGKIEGRKVWSLARSKLNLENVVILGAKSDTVGCGLHSFVSCRGRVVSYFEHCNKPSVMHKMRTVYWLAVGTSCKTPCFIKFCSFSSIEFHRFIGRWYSFGKCRQLMAKLSNLKSNAWTRSAVVEKLFMYGKTDIGKKMKVFAVLVSRKKKKNIEVIKFRNFWYLLWMFPHNACAATQKPVSVFSQFAAGYLSIFFSKLSN